jgi:hypothetical protein
MTQYVIPQAETFNLLGEEKDEKYKEQNKKDLSQSVSHLKSRITFMIMTDNIKLPLNNIPIELSNNLR